MAVYPDKSDFESHLPNGAKRCQAWKSDRSAQCRGSAVKGTDKCRTHSGGKGGRPAKHGRYGKVANTALATKIAEYHADESPGDLTEELGLMRGLLAAYLEKIPEGEEGDFEHIERVYAMVTKMALVVERISRMLNDTALTQAEVQVMQARIADAIQQYVPESDRLSFLRAIGAPV